MKVPLPQKRRGWFEVTFRLLDAERHLLDRSTTFALLPPDTRKATYRDSPFGTKYRAEEDRGSSLERCGPLMQKAGIRLLMGWATPEQMRKYGLNRFQFQSVVGRKEIRKHRRQFMQAVFDKWPDTTDALLLHRAFSGRIKTHPAFVLGKTPEPLDEASGREFERQWRFALEADALRGVVEAFLKEAEQRAMVS